MAQAARLVAERRALPGLTGSNYDPVQLVASNSGDKKSTDVLERALARLGKWSPSAANGQEAGAGEPR